MDNWRLLSDCLPAWLSAETGKGPDAETPGQSGSLRIKRDQRQEGEPDGRSGHAHMDKALPMGRRMTVATASPKAVGCPARAAVIRLVIDNGDRPERWEERASGRSIAQAAGGGRTATSNLRIVV